VQGAIIDCNTALALNPRKVLALLARAGAKHKLNNYEVSCCFRHARTPIATILDVCRPHYPDLAVNTASQLLSLDI